jgi:stage II sporulation protein D
MGFKRKIRCPYCAGSPAWTWNLELRLDDLGRELRRGMLGDDFAEGTRDWPRDWKSIVSVGKLAAVTPLGAGADGRIERVGTTWRVQRPRGVETVSLVVPSARLRDWIGPARMKSTFFAVVGARPGVLRLEGHGNGHGVGMCQWGAKMMGDRGFKMAAILKFYYPDAALNKLW